MLVSVSPYECGAEVGFALYAVSGVSVRVPHWVCMQVGVHFPALDAKVEAPEFAVGEKREGLIHKAELHTYARDLKPHGLGPVVDRLYEIWVILLTGCVARGNLIGRRLLTEPESFCGFFPA